VELSPDKTIAYTLTATNAGGTVSKSVVIYVTAPPIQPPPPPDTTPPVIKDISPLSATETSAVIIWTTNEPGSSQVEYGKTTEYGLTATSTELTTDHSVTLSGLEPNTAYHYQVKSRDEAGNEASSIDNTFVTTQEKSPYSMELQSLEWGRKTEGTAYDLGAIPTEVRNYLFVKGTVQNRSQATLRAVICTMNCWNGNLLVKYAVYVHRSPILPGQAFAFNIQTGDDPTVTNVTVEFADSMGRDIEVNKK
jgi:PKD repeat protein